MPSFPPTPEQISIDNHFRAGRDLVIQAGAGCGKTASLSILAETLHETRPAATGIYITLNKAVADEVGARFEKGNVQASTIHSLALRILSSIEPKVAQMAQRRLSTPMKPFLKPEAIGADSGVMAFDNGQLVLSPERFGKPTGSYGGKKLSQMKKGCRYIKAYSIYAAAAETVRRFCISDSLELEWKFAAHVLSSKPEWRVPEQAEGKVISRIHEVAQKIWEDAMDMNGKLPYDHDWYLKVVTAHPKALFNTSLGLAPGSVLFFDEAQDSRPAVTSLIERQRGHMQIVTVGDSSQSIYCQPVGTKVTRADGSKAWIEDLNEGDTLLTSSKGKKSEGVVTSFERFPYSGDLIRATMPVEDDYAISVYTPEHHCIVKFTEDALENDYIVYVLRRGERFRLGVSPLAYRSQGGVLGLNRRLQAEDADEGWIVKVSSSYAAAESLAAQLSLTYQIPLHSLDNSMWYPQEGNREHATKLLHDTGRSVYFPLVSRNQTLSGRRPNVVQACNLFEGMTMMHSSGSWIGVKIANVEGADTDVVSISVSPDENYFADDILTHNSFTGAKDALAKFSQWENVDELPLTTSWRFGEGIAEVANEFLDALEAPIRIHGNPSKETSYVEFEEPEYVNLSEIDAVICRTNAQVIGSVNEATLYGLKVYCEVDVSHLIRTAEDVLLLESGRPAVSNPLKVFANDRELNDYLSEAASNDDIATLVNQILKIGPYQVIEALSGVVNERDSDITVSTIHKAKGRQWGNVLVNVEPDQIMPRDRGDDLPVTTISKDNLMLLYVAVTRGEERSIVHPTIMAMVRRMNELRQLGFS